MTTPTVGDRLDHTHISHPSRQRPAQALRSEHLKGTRAHGRRVARICGALGAVAALVVLAGCSDETTTLRKGPGWSAVLDSPSASDTEPSTSARSGGEDSTPNPRGGSGPTAPPSSPEQSTTAPKEKPNGKSKATRLGQLHPPPGQDAVGAPYDPCTVLTWDDFPQEVRPQAPKPRKPSPRAPEPDSTYAIACSWQANGPITIKSDGTSSGSGMFSTWVVWGKNGQMNPNPSNSTPATFGPAQGSLAPNTSSQGAPMCTGFAALTNGVAGVSILNSKAPQLDTCAIVTDLLTRIATKHN
jgi:hypothetical protein